MADKVISPLKSEIVRDENKENTKWDGEVELMLKHYFERKDECDNCCLFCESVPDLDDRFRDVKDSDGNVVPYKVLLYRAICDFPKQTLLNSISDCISVVLLVPGEILINLDSKALAAISIQLDMDLSWHSNAVQRRVYKSILLTLSEEERKEYTAMYNAPLADE